MNGLVVAAALNLVSDPPHSERVAVLYHLAKEHPRQVIEAIDRVSQHRGGGSDD